MGKQIHWLLPGPNDLALAISCGLACYWRSGGTHPAEQRHLAACTPATFPWDRLASGGLTQPPGSFEQAHSHTLTALSQGYAWWIGQVEMSGWTRAQIHRQASHWANSLPLATHDLRPIASVGSEQFQPQAVGLTGVDSLPLLLSAWLLSATPGRIARPGDGGLERGVSQRARHFLTDFQWHSDLAPACASHARRSYFARPRCRPHARWHHTETWSAHFPPDHLWAGPEHDQ